MTSSGKMVVLMYSNSPSLVRISRIGLDKDFFSMAQTPTTTAWKVKDKIVLLQGNYGAYT